MIDKQVSKWFMEQYQNLYADFYVYYRPAKGMEKGDVVIAEEPPTSEYVKKEKMSIDWSVTVARQRLINICWKLPIVPNV